MRANADSLFESRFAQEAESLRRRGISLADMSAGEVAALVHAVERVVSPFTEVNAELAERPVPVCDGVWLWPPTVGAQLWLDEYAEKWWPKGSLWNFWAQAYALTNARDPNAFHGLTTKLAATKAVLKCALRLAVHGKELADAIARAYGASPSYVPRRRKSRADKLREQAQADFASLVALLEVQSGVPRDEWLWDRSLVYAANAYCELHYFAAAYSAGGSAAKRMHDELDDALKDLVAVKTAIAERIGGEKAADNADGASCAPEENA